MLDIEIPPLATGGPPPAVAFVVVGLLFAALRTWQWRRLQDRRIANPDAELVTVLSVYQKARTGTKAVILRPGRGRQDAWFEGRRVRAGSYVLVAGHTGWGPHNANPAVFYAGRVVATCGVTGPLVSGTVARLTSPLRRSGPAPPAR